MGRISIGRAAALVAANTNPTPVKGNIRPRSNGGTDLGTGSKRFGNLYVQDLNLANERGDYTVIEEEDYLSLRNNKTGKTYRFVLEEIIEPGEDE